MSVCSQKPGAAPGSCCPIGLFHIKLQLSVIMLKQHRLRLMQTGSNEMIQLLYNSLSHTVYSAMNTQHSATHTFFQLC